jgi:hypothetical protein
MYVCMYLCMCIDMAVYYDTVFCYHLLYSAVRLSAGMSAGVCVSVWEIGGVGHYPSDLVAPASTFVLRSMTPADDVIKVKYYLFQPTHHTYIRKLYSYIHILTNSYIYIHTYIHTYIYTYFF